MNRLLLTIILLPLALLIIFVSILAFIVGLYIMLGVFRSGRHLAIDTTNYAGRLLGFVQLSRHIPGLMKLVAIDTDQGQWRDIAEGEYKVTAMRPETDEAPPKFLPFAGRCYEFIVRT